MNRRIDSLLLVGMLLAACGPKESAAAPYIRQAKEDAFLACALFVERQMANTSGVSVTDADEWRDEDITQLGGQFTVTLHYPRQGYFLCVVNRVSDEGDWELADLSYLGLTK